MNLKYFNFKDIIDVIKVNYEEYLLLCWFSKN